MGGEGKTGELFVFSLSFAFLSFGMLSYCMALPKTCSLVQKNTLQCW